MSANAVSRGSPIAPTQFMMNLHEPCFNKLFANPGQPPTEFENLFNRFQANFIPSYRNIGEASVPLSERAREQEVFNRLSSYTKKIAVIALAARGNECEFPLSALETLSRPSAEVAKALIAPIAYVFNNVIKGTQLTTLESGGKITFKLTWQDPKVFEEKISQAFLITFPPTKENIDIFDSEICELPEYEGFSEGDPRTGVVKAYFIYNPDDQNQPAEALTKIRKYTNFSAEISKQETVEDPEDADTVNDTNTEVSDTNHPETAAQTPAAETEPKRAYTVDDYTGNYVFMQSAFCHRKAEDLNHFAKKKMLELYRKGGGYTFASHVISPFVGIGTMLASLCLRIGSMLEPIFGIFSDLGAAAYFRSPRPALHCIYRVGHIFRNVVYNCVLGIPRDVIKIGLGASVGGIFFPRWAYNNLSNIA